MKIVGLALVGALIGLVLKKNNPEQGYLSSLAVICAIVLASLPPLMAIIDFCRQLAVSAGMNASLLDVLIKSLGISIVVRIAVELCHDAKEQGIAAALEMGGSALILYVSLPLFSEVYKLIVSML